MRDERKSERKVASTLLSGSQTANGVSRRDVLALLAAFGVPDAALAAPDSALDPVKVMPKNFRVAFENDMVRVLEYNNRPGMGPCGAGLHYHPRHIDIFLTSFRGQSREDGKISTGQAKAGDVKPVLRNRCFSCHGAVRQKAGLRLDAASLIRKGGKHGPALVPGKSAESLLVRAVLGDMKPREAQLLLLRSSGLAYRELAQTLGIQPGSVGTLLTRAEAEFERRFRARYGDDV